MKHLFSKKIISIFFTLIIFGLFSLYFSPKITFAQGAIPLDPTIVPIQGGLDLSNNLSGGYTNITPGGLPTGSVGGGGFGGLLGGLFTWAVGLTGILAVVMIVVGGVQYMGSDSLFAKDKGRERIQAAIGGLLIALASVLILTTILGPEGASFNFDF